MTEKELRKKLRKKAKKLAKWGKRHGIPYASMFYMLNGHGGKDDFIYVNGDTGEGSKFTWTGFLGDEDE